MSCENCTYAAVAAKKKKLSKGCYTQRDSGRVWTTPEMSGQGLHYGSHYGPHHGFWDSKRMYEDEYTAVKIDCTNRLNGNKSLIAIDNATYSDSIVLSAIPS